MTSNIVSERNACRSAGVSLLLLLHKERSHFTRCPSLRDYTMREYPLGYPEDPDWDFQVVGGNQELPQFPSGSFAEGNN